jgi:hypothetical protein
MADALPPLGNEFTRFPDDSRLFEWTNKLPAKFAEAIVTLRQRVPDATGDAHGYRWIERDGMTLLQLESLRLELDQIERSRGYTMGSLYDFEVWRTREGTWTVMAQAKSRLPGRAPTRRYREA